MSNLVHESTYRELVESFLAGVISADQFVAHYFDQWRKDRDLQWRQVNTGHELTSEERALSEVLDAVFTACDAYSPSPEGECEIDGQQLLSEVRSCASKRWFLPG